MACMVPPMANVLFCWFVLNMYPPPPPPPPPPCQEVTATDIIQQGAFMGTTAAFHSH